MNNYEQGEQSERPLALTMRDSVEFIANIREVLADRIEERATDPNENAEHLFEFAEQVRRGIKIPHRPSTIELVAGVCFQSPLARKYYFTPKDVEYFVGLFLEDDDA